MSAVQAPDRSWMKDAACRNVRGVNFFSEDPVEIDRAKAICEACPVRTACLAFARQNGEQNGVWGGLAEYERDIVDRSNDCLACGGVLVQISGSREQCLACGWIYFSPA